MMLLPGSSPLSRGASLESHVIFGAEHASFHQHGTILAIWLLVCFVAVEILTKARTIVEPILWAFFLMMGLVPLTDVIERLLLRAAGFCCRIGRAGGRGGFSTPPRRRPSRRHTGSEAAEGDDLAEDAPDSQGSEGRPTPPSPAAPVLLPAGGTEAPAASEMRPLPGEERCDSDTDTVSDSEGGCCSVKGSGVRTIAVLTVIVLSASCAALFFVMVYKSAMHMQESWPHYQRGAQSITNRTQVWMHTLPDNVLEKLIDKGLSGLEQGLNTLVGGILEATTHTAAELLWVCLYAMFWLCQPVHIGKNISSVFRRYIFLKGVASAGYALCIWILLHCLGVDLAIVFGLITFVLNFIPEVGPFVAMMLPLPLILFDDRMKRPLELMLLALAGQVSLKVVFGNIVEIKLIESQQEMRMHPVVILFFVAFFQYIWGATGMLLSVPIVAALKATLHKLPPAYRDLILIFLEGDKTAPARWQQWRSSLRGDAL